MASPFLPLQRYEFTPVLGWSVSRYDRFTTCKRMYYFDYYGRFAPPTQRTTIEKLKKMTSVPLEIGTIVHDMVKRLLERLLVSEAPIDREKFLDFARGMTENYCRSKQFCEVYYRVVPAVDPDEVFADVAVALRNFLDSPRYRWIVEKAITNKADWVVEPSGYGETRIGGLKAYCKVDFLFPVDNQFHILDWKTGRPDEEKHRKQLLGYALWATNHFNVPATAVHPTIVYLRPAYAELAVDADEGALEALVNQVHRETAEMQAFCADVEQNVPRDMEEFPMTDRTAVCRACNYRELCRR